MSDIDIESDETFTDLSDDGDDDDVIGDDMDIAIVERDQNVMISAESRNLTSTWINKLTKYEITRLIGTRARMIQSGSPPLVKPEDGDTPITLARKELSEGKIPFIVRRFTSSKEYIDVSPSNMAS